MSLATRCTVCGTVFRVVQDQLKVSEGWVRCGRCSEVFNALEGLFDLEREAPPEWTPAPGATGLPGRRSDDSADPSVRGALFSAPQVAAPSFSAPTYSDPPYSPPPYSPPPYSPPALSPPVYAPSSYSPAGDAAPYSTPAHAPIPTPRIGTASPTSLFGTTRVEPTPPGSPFASASGSQAWRAEQEFTELPFDEGARFDLPYTEELDPEPIDDPSLIDKIDAQLLGSRRHESHSTPANRVSERDRLDFPDARFDPDSMPYESSDAEAMAAPLWHAGSVPAAEEAANVAPEFVRRAQRQARWQSPAMRALLTLAFVVFAAVLSLQGFHRFRDTIAARWPGTKPSLLAWCALAACKVEAPRRIEDVSVESTALTKGAAPDAFKLSVALRNRGALTVALPSVDLSLTDPNGQLLVRRVLGPRDFRAASALMAPGAETALQVSLVAAGLKVTGYTVEIFYP